jgi:hypothetical protein
MASNQETGHAVNVSNFKLVIDNVSALGAPYNPSNTKIQLAQMMAKWNGAKTAHDTLTQAMQNAKGPINDREILYKPMNKYVTRILKILNSTEASKEVKKDAKGLADKFRGHKVKVKLLPDGTPDPADVSNSHLSFVQKADTFKQLVDLLAAEPLYAPNEVDFQAATLATLAAALKTANDNIGTIIAPVSVKRIERNDALYNEEDGVIMRAAAVKEYVEGIAGVNSETARIFRRIKFRKPPKK